MTAGYGTPVGDAFSLLDPDVLARNYLSATRTTCSARGLGRVFAALNQLAARVPRIIYASFWPGGPFVGGTNWLARWLVPDYVQNATSHEFRTLSMLRTTDPATGNAYWARVDHLLAEDTTCTGGEYAGEAPNVYSAQQIFGERATWARTGTNRAPEDAMQHEGIVCKHSHRLHGLIVQDTALRMLDLQDHVGVHSLITRGDPVLGGHVLEKARAALHEIRTTNLPIVISWAAIGDGTSFAVTTANNDADEYGIHITNNATMLNVMAPLLSVARSFETYTANTPGWHYHAYRCGVGDESTAAGAKVKINCYVLANAINTNATVRFEGPKSIASNNATITITTTSGLDWFGGTGSNVYFDTTVANNNATNARAKIDICGKAGEGGELWIYGIFAHISYA